LFIDVCVSKVAPLLFVSLTTLCCQLITAVCQLILSESINKVTVVEIFALGSNCLPAENLLALTVRLSDANLFQLKIHDDIQLLVFVTVVCCS